MFNRFCFAQNIGHDDQIIKQYAAKFNDANFYKQKPAVILVKLNAANAAFIKMKSYDS